MYDRWPFFSGDLVVRLSPMRKTIHIFISIKFLQVSRLSSVAIIEQVSVEDTGDGPLTLALRSLGFLSISQVLFSS